MVNGRNKRQIEIILCQFKSQAGENTSKNYMNVLKISKIVVGRPQKLSYLFFKIYRQYQGGAIWICQYEFRGNSFFHGHPKTIGDDKPKGIRFCIVN